MMNDEVCLAQESLVWLQSNFAINGAWRKQSRNGLYSQCLMLGISSKMMRDDVASKDSSSVLQFSE